MPTSALRRPSRIRRSYAWNVSGFRYVVGGAAVAWVAWLAILLSASPAERTATHAPVQAGSFTR